MKRRERLQAWLCHFVTKPHSRRTWRGPDITSTEPYTTWSPTRVYVVKKSFFLPAYASMDDCIAFVLDSTLDARDDQYKMICHVHYHYNDYKDNEHAGMNQTGYIRVELFNNTTTIVIGNPYKLPVQEREIGVLQ